MPNLRKRVGYKYTLKTCFHLSAQYKGCLLSCFYWTFPFPLVSNPLIFCFTCLPPSWIQFFSSCICPTSVRLLPLNMSTLSFSPTYLNFIMFAQHSSSSNNPHAQTHTLSSPVSVPFPVPLPLEPTPFPFRLPLLSFSSIPACWRTQYCIPNLLFFSKP